MLEYAYQLKSFHFLDGLSNFDKLEDFYNYLANILARRIRDRAKQGLYRTYIPKSDRMTFRARTHGLTAIGTTTVGSQNQVPLQRAHA
jgi:hypothetical protein